MSLHQVNSALTLICFRDIRRLFFYIYGLIKKNLLYKEPDLEGFLLKANGIASVSIQVFFTRLLLLSCAILYSSH